MIKKWSNQKWIHFKTSRDGDLTKNINQNIIVLVWYKSYWKESSSEHSSCQQHTVIPRSDFCFCLLPWSCDHTEYLLCLYSGSRIDRRDGGASQWEENFRTFLLFHYLFVDRTQVFYFWKTETININTICIHLGIAQSLWNKKYLIIADANRLKNI